MVNADRGYSAQFDGYLIVGDRSFPLARLGPSSLGLAKPVDLPPTEGEIVLVIDGFEQRTRILLDDGVESQRHEAAYRAI
jgi:hypothetical protein